MSSLLVKTSWKKAATGRIGKRDEEVGKRGRYWGGDVERFWGRPCAAEGCSTALERRERRERLERQPKRYIGA